MKIQWNKVTWYSWTLTAVIFLILVPLLTSYFYKQYKEITITVVSPVPLPDMTEYIDHENGFSIEYPYTLSIQTSNLPNSRFAKVLLVATSGPETLTIAIDDNPSNLINCMTFFSDETATGTLDINGVPFSRRSIPDAGAGSYAIHTSYSTTKNNTCYSMNLNSATIYPYDATGQESKEQRDILISEARLKAIIMSFKFLSK